VGRQAKGEELMSIAEILLVIGTFGICTGVWVTLLVIIRHHKINQLDARIRNTDERVNESHIP
jgi:beta-lactamase regulating signal transducer with metallopeptidase domain